jgi:hypothetical protein
MEQPAATPVLVLLGSASHAILAHAVVDRLCDALIIFSYFVRGHPRMAASLEPPKIVDLSFANMDTRAFYAFVDMQLNGTPVECRLHAEVHHIACVLNGGDNGLVQWRHPPRCPDADVGDAFQWTIVSMQDVRSLLWTHQRQKQLEDDGFSFTVATQDGHLYRRPRRS